MVEQEASRINCYTACKNLGAFVATTVSAYDKVFVQELGADHVIENKSQT